MTASGSLNRMKIFCFMTPGISRARCTSIGALIDVRSPGEYRGEITHMPEYPQEGVLRGGHIPGAKSMPWKTATNDDATFKPASELAKIYFEQCGVTPEKDTVVYCRIGERSSHTWFVLTYLLGLENVRNYDGSC